MVTRKKFVLPKIDQEEMTPEIARLLAFVEGLSGRADTLYKEAQVLEAELARLRKAKKQKKRVRK